MAYDLTLSVRTGDVVPIYASASADSGTLTISNAPTVSLLDSTGTAVSGYDSLPVTGYDASALATVRAWYTLNTTTLAAGVYVAQFSFDVISSVDSITRTEVIEVEVKVLSAVSAWPISGETLRSYVIGMDLFDDPPTAGQNALDFEGAVEDAIADWENATHCTPFLADPTPSARIFNGPESNILSLRAGLLSLTSLVLQNVTYQENQQFVLGPSNARAKGRPYTYVDFGTSPFGNSWVDTWGGNFANLGVIGGGRHIITITGVWGYCARVPADVKRAVLGRAFVHLYPQLAVQISGGLYSQRDQNSEVRYGGGKVTPLSLERDALQLEFETAVKGYVLSQM